MTIAGDCFGRGKDPLKDGEKRHPSGKTCKSKGYKFLVMVLVNRRETLNRIFP
jgi:hypothetical protein